MLFYKPLFSFVVAFAAASSVVASAIPVEDRDSDLDPKPYFGEHGALHDAA